MGSSKVRPAPRCPGLRLCLPVAVAVLAGLARGGVAHAGKNDLQLINLCDPHVVAGIGSECSWVKRDATGNITGPVTVDADGQSRFRSLMSELGVVIAPRLQTPADTLGYAGFQFSAELGFTKINASQPYWNGVAGVDPANPMAARADSYLTTVGAFVRKGLWLPLPAFEFGAGAVNIVGSRMYAVQGYAKLALQEGFHGWWLPSLAVRGSVSQLLGTEQVDLDVFGIDVLISKAFGIAGTLRLEPFLGWNFLFIDATSGVIDATPACDAYAERQATAGAPPVSSHCAASQNGTWNDLNANFTFPQQDVITRQRFSAGFKVKLAVLFLEASTTSSRPAIAATSVSRRQPAMSAEASKAFRCRAASTSESARASRSRSRGLRPRPTPKRRSRRCRPRRPCRHPCRWSQRRGCRACRAGSCRRRGHTALDDLPKAGH